MSIDFHTTSLHAQCYRAVPAWKPFINPEPERAAWTVIAGNEARAVLLRRSSGFRLFARLKSAY